VHKYVEQYFLPNINNNLYLELVNDGFLMNHYLIFENLYKIKKYFLLSLKMSSFYGIEEKKVIYIID